MRRKRSIIHEWVVEELEDDEIVHVAVFDTLTEAKGFADAVEGEKSIALRRSVIVRRDNGSNDVAQWQYAYPGDTEYDGGLAIGSRHRKALDRLMSQGYG